VQDAHAAFAQRASVHVERETIAFEDERSGRDRSSRIVELSADKAIRLLLAEREARISFADLTRFSSMRGAILRFSM